MFLKIPMSWLNEYLNIDVDPVTFCEKMTMSGTKVEKIESVGSDPKGLIAGKILKIEKHPNADRLVVCSVDIISEVLQIITGATNVFEGAVVPVATCGCVLPNGMKIKKSKMRGVTSYGMLCSEEELGLSSRDHDGILILSDDFSAGDDLSSAFQNRDSIIEFELTSNRPDCQGIVGIAMEAAVTLGKKLLKPISSDFWEEKDIPLQGCKVSIDIDKSKNSSLFPCLRYSGKIIKNVRIGPSPKWICDRLLLCGVKPVNNVVDITNYVMIEYGQPMHAFDLSTLKGSSIAVRYAEKGERLLTLDDKVHNLDEDTLVIADNEEPIAIAGIIGGKGSSVTDATSVVFLESANFDSSCIRRTSNFLGVKTDACSKFEKSLPESLVVSAMNRACQLISELGIGDVQDGVFDFVHEDVCIPNGVPFDPDYINGLLGTDISVEFMKDTLLQLGFTFKGESEVIPPHFRKDVSIPADIAEEIARIYGYDNIPETFYLGRRIDNSVSLHQKVRQLSADNFVGQGLCEIMTYSFIDEREYSLLMLPIPQLIRIRNPLGAEHSVMRTTSLGSMISVLSKNINYKNEEVRLFEFAKVYNPPAECINPVDQLSEKEDYSMPKEREILTCGMYGNCDFYDLKGYIENLLDGLGIKDYSFKPYDTHPSFHPGKTAVLFIGVENVGILGAVHPVVLRNYGIKKECFVSCLEFEALVKYANLNRVYDPLPRYPSVRRDVAVVVDENITAGEVYSTICSVKSNIIKDVILFDVYHGEQIEKGTKSLAYSIVFNSVDKTLTDDEVNVIFDKIVSKLKTELQASFR